MEKKVYKTKIGWETVVMLVVILVPQIVLAFFNPFSLYGVLLLLGVALLIVFTSLKTVYTIEGGNLNIKSGIFYNKTIPIKTIRKITETRSPLSSPAMSLDRIEVFFNKFDSVIISPKEKQEFITHLKQINPDIAFIPHKKQVKG